MEIGDRITSCDTKVINILASNSLGSTYSHHKTPNRRIQYFPISTNVSVNHHLDYHLHLDLVKPATLHTFVALRARRNVQ